MDFLNCLKMSTEAEAEVLRLRTSKDIPQNLPHLNTAQLSLSPLPHMTLYLNMGVVWNPPSYNWAYTPHPVQTPRRKEIPYLARLLRRGRLARVNGLRRSRLRRLDRLWRRLWRFGQHAQRVAGRQVHRLGRKLNYTTAALRRRLGATRKRLAGYHVPCVPDVLERTSMESTGFSIVLLGHECQSFGQCIGKRLES